MERIKEKKICRSCEKEKTLVEFNRSSASKDGRRPDCSICRNIKRRSAYAANPLPFIVASAKWKKENPEKRKQHTRRYQLKSRYGITLEEYLVLLAKQEGVCAICRQLPVGHGKRDGFLDVDHDHLTTKVRGLLCTNCNLSLGGFKDNIELLKAAIEYLRKS